MVLKLCFTVDKQVGKHPSYIHYFIPVFCVWLGLGLQCMSVNKHIFSSGVSIVIFLFLGSLTEERTVSQGLFHLYLRVKRKLLQRRNERKANNSLHCIFTHIDNMTLYSSNTLHILLLFCSIQCTVVLQTLQKET